MTSLYNVMEIDVKRYRTIISHHLITIHHLHIGALYYRTPCRPCLRSLVNHTLFFHQQLLMCQSACFQKRGSLLFGILISCVFGCPKVQHMEKALQMAVSMIPNLVMLTWLGLMIHSTFWSTSTAVYIDYYRPMAKIRRTWDLENPVQLQEFIQFNSITTIKPS